MFKLFKTRNDYLDEIDYTEDVSMFPSLEAEIDHTPTVFEQVLDKCDEIEAKLDILLERVGK